MLSAEIDFACGSLAKTGGFYTAFAGSGFAMTGAEPVHTRFVSHHEIEALLDSPCYRAEETDHDWGN